MALATLHLVAIPVLASLAAGTGVVATYVAPATPAVEAAVAPDCSARAWPYAGRGCVADTGSERKVRLVMAPRPSEAFAVRWVDVPPTPVRQAGPGFTTSDGVLRGPQNPEAIPDTPVTPPKTKHREVRREKRTRDVSRVATTQPYQVRVERSDETREVTVIRPLRYD